MIAKRILNRPVVIVTLTLLMVGGIVWLVRAQPPTPSGLVVHEWGTFTSIAGDDGVALDWRPLNGAADLPGFVYEIGPSTNGVGLRFGACPKCEMHGTVRMETPVIYFYADRETEASVTVNFPGGKITEWYPQAAFVWSGIAWGTFKILPGTTAQLPFASDGSHYYAARNTDSALVRVCGKPDKPTEYEKFLFYRGVGTFDLPLSATLEGNHVIVRNTGTNEIQQAILFENRSGQVGYTVIDSIQDAAAVQRPALGQSIDSLYADLQDALVAHGLYEKEAQAMIDTWRDSWFEEGLRVFYVFPRERTDAVLPITISPKPSELERVLVGRMEIITPELATAVQRQLSRLDSAPRERDAALQDLHKHGRFTEPILKRILAKTQDAKLRDEIRQLLVRGERNQ